MAVFTVSTRLKLNSVAYIYFVNHTRKATLNFNLTNLIKEIPRSSVYEEAYGSSYTHTTSFPYRSRKSVIFWWWTVPFKGRFIKVDAMPVLSIDKGPRISLKFDGKINNWIDVQYINWIPTENYKVTKDEVSITELKSDKYRLTLDGGGYKRYTKNIYIQLYDV